MHTTWSTWFLVLVSTAATGQTFTGDSPFSNDQFGFSVAIDANVAVVGARFDNENGAEAGAAYIYTHDGTSWTLLQKIAGTVAGHQFGYSVAVVVDRSGLNEGDFVAVGSLLGAGVTSFSGNVTIFRRTDPAGTFALQQVLAAGDGGGFDEFGHAIDLDLSVPGNSQSGDPVYTLVVGAPDFDIRGSDAGAIYVCALSPDGSAWSCYDQMIPDDIAGGDLLGRAVSIHGDIIVAGATGWPFNANPEGVAYLMRRFNDTGAGFFNWEVDNRLKASDGLSGDRFGASVSVTDGVIGVGAPNAGMVNGSEGAVYLFSGPTIDFTITESTQIAPPDPNNSVDFGSTLVLDRNLLATTDQSGSGRLHVYRATETQTYIPLEVLTVSDPNVVRTGASMAFSVPNALLGDTPARAGGGAAYILSSNKIFAASFEGN